MDLRYKMHFLVDAIFIFLLYQYAQLRENTYIYIYNLNDDELQPKVNNISIRSVNGLQKGPMRLIFIFVRYS